ncbi:MAG: DUF3343 domain-containing protein [Clostridia bacterium]|nr:DUF3343 domain-containing protein [Clostridia bacterium]
MTYYLVVFRSRSETMKFANLLSSYGYKTAFVNTPRQLSVSCGISAKIEKSSLIIAREILNRRQFYTFAGIYYSDNNEYIKI